MSHMPGKSSSIFLIMRKKLMRLFSFCLSLAYNQFSLFRFFSCSVVSLSLLFFFHPRWHYLVIYVWDNQFSSIRNTGFSGRHMKLFEPKKIKETKIKIKTTYKKKKRNRFTLNEQKIRTKKKMKKKQKHWFTSVFFCCFCFFYLFVSSKWKKKPKK